MNLQQLKTQIRAGAIDTIIVAFPDPFGRLVGKRFRADVFLDSVLKHGTHGCNYLLTVNMEMDPLDGFKVASWDAGFGDFAFRPDMKTLRALPWQTGAALVICDYVRQDGSLVREAPRSVLRQQLEFLYKQGFTCFCASELEFYLFNQTYHSAFAAGYRDLQPSSDYRIDYHVMQPTRDEPLMRAIRNSMTTAGVPVESSKGEWSRGQHEINFIYTEPLSMADMHVLFKQGVKEIADQNGKAVSFMAKYAPSEAGNSCHIHISLWKGGRNLFWESGAKHQAKRNTQHGARKSYDAGSSLFRHFLGGLIKYSPELCLFFGPTINSYKRYQPGSWAPTRMAWAAMLAAGLAGIKEKLDCGNEYVGNAYVDPKLARLPGSLSDAAALFDNSKLARAAFGDDVVGFYVHHARLEIDAFNNAVTDWEKIRYFERI